MSLQTTETLEEINRKLEFSTPKEIIQWALKEAKNPVVTTNFRPYESAILFAVSEVVPKIKILWCDTGYNTPQTYRHAKELTELLDLCVQTYVPRQTVAYRNTFLGGIPPVESPKHALFTEQVKLEPFRRALEEHKPDEIGRASCRERVYAPV